MTVPGLIIILNGVPRAGKTSIARAMQKHDNRHWLNIGVDAHISMLPERLKPGIGLRPGGERPDIEADISSLYAALFMSIAAHAQQGFNVVADLGIHDGYSTPLGIWQECAKIFEGLRVLIVGVRCGLAEIMRRREASGVNYAGLQPDGSVPTIVTEWERMVHGQSNYDLEVDTGEHDAEQCALHILRAANDLSTG